MNNQQLLTMPLPIVQILSVAPPTKQEFRKEFPLAVYSGRDRAFHLNYHDYLRFSNSVWSHRRLNFAVKGEEVFSL